MTMSYGQIRGKVHSLVLKTWQVGMCKIKHPYLERVIHPALWEQSLACAAPQMIFRHCLGKTSLKGLKFAPRWKWSSQ